MTHRDSDIEHDRFIATHHLDRTHIGDMLPELGWSATGPRITYRYFEKCPLNELIQLCEGGALDMCSFCSQQEPGTKLKRNTLCSKAECVRRARFGSYLRSICISETETLAAGRKRCSLHLHSLSRALDDPGLSSMNVTSGAELPYRFSYPRRVSGALR